MSEFNDHFSDVAQGYAAFRPRYPDALFAALASLAPARDVVWDCGCGTGQASVALGAHFGQVHATDASAQQIALAEPHERVTYRVAPSHASGLTNGSAALVTVAQALHWFDVDAFHAEARRVLVSGGVIAEWCYTLLDVPSAPLVADVVNAMDARMRMWWPPQRRHVDSGYDDLAFPFERLDIGAFAMEAEWSARQLAGYVATWSAVSRYRAAHGVDPTVEFTRRVTSVWGDVERHTIRWPMVLRVGRVP
ncbi:MAG: class I SAM-dependent methyltransferase [Gemmatimonas sp.]